MASNPVFIDCIQGSPEWLSLRAGIPTASCFDSIVTSKGEPSKSAKKYLYQLAGERLLGAPVIGYQNDNMIRGQELEAEARQAYELIMGVEVKQAGFCFSDDRRLYGCSPDGLIGDDGGLEIKCPTLSVAVEYLDKGRLPTAYVQQVQGTLFVTGRVYWDFMSYYPGLPPLIVRVERDEPLLSALAIELEAFCGELDEMVARMLEKYLKEVEK